MQVVPLLLPIHLGYLRGSLSQPSLKTEISGQIIATSFAGWDSQAPGKGQIIATTHDLTPKGS